MRPIGPALGMLVLASAFFAFPVRADVVGPPPLDCARGLRGHSSHGGPYCDFDPCADDRTCTGERTCVARSYCTYSRPGNAVGGAFVDVVATRPCESDADCGDGACTPADVCLDVTAHRIRGLVMVSFGVVALGVVVWLAVMSFRSRRRPHVETRMPPR